MIPLHTTLLHGAIISIPFALFAIISFWTKPRLWLHSLPQDIQKMVPPKSKKENKQTIILLIIYLAILPGLSIYSLYYQSFTYSITFLNAFVHLYGIWLFVHLFDFIFIDCIHIQIINPSTPPIIGTKNAKGWTNYTFHFKSFITAAWKSLYFVIPTSIIASFLL